MRAAFLFLLCGLASAWAADQACTQNRYGQMVCPPPDATCVVDRVGEVVCSTPGGGITIDRYGDPVCGPGHCTRDIRGEFLCSSAPRGAAAIDRYGVATCAEGCVPATAQACVKPVPAR